MSMKAEIDYSRIIFFRQHKAFEVGTKVAPQRLSYKEVRPLLFASNKDADNAIASMLTGRRIRTRYGTYWAEHRV